MLVPDITSGWWIFLSGGVWSVIRSSGMQTWHFYSGCWAATTSYIALVIWGSLCPSGLFFQGSGLFAALNWIDYNISLWSGLFCHMSYRVVKQILAFFCSVTVFVVIVIVV